MFGDNFEFILKNLPSQEEELEVFANQKISNKSGKIDFSQTNMKKILLTDTKLARLFVEKNNNKTLSFGKTNGGGKKFSFSQGMLLKLQEKSGSAKNLRNAELGRLKKGKLVTEGKGPFEGGSRKRRMKKSKRNKRNKKQSKKLRNKKSKKNKKRKSIRK